MKLDRGSTPEKPSVTRTATPAILWVALEVCVFTALLGLAMSALPGLHTVPGDVSGPDVDGPDAHGVRDYMLRYMGQVFVGHALGPWWGRRSARVVAVVFGLLLLSAVNTAIGDLITIQFLMSRDGEMPPVFRSLNRFGVAGLSSGCSCQLPPPRSSRVGPRSAARAAVPTPTIRHGQIRSRNLATAGAQTNTDGDQCFALSSVFIRAPSVANSSEPPLTRPRP